MNGILTNDDGMNSEGLTVLASALQQKGHAVAVVLSKTGKADKRWQK